MGARDVLTKAALRAASSLRPPSGARTTTVDQATLHRATGAASGPSPAPSSSGRGATDDLTGGFGPGEALPPTPLDASGRPRRFQYRPGINLPTNPGEGRIDYATLKTLADTYDLGRKCIEIRKDEIARLAWDIVPTAASVTEKRAALRANAAKIDRARAFFDSPDRVDPWQSWIRALLEDYFVGDYVALYRRRTYGGDLYALEGVDGATIRPLLTIQGRTPLPPDPAYQQVLYGIPRVDFTTRELLYRPKNRRNSTVYGFSPMEQFASHINQALRWQIWNTRLFTDGNIPQAIFAAPKEWSADQIEEFQQLWDALMAGDPQMQRRLRFVPNGTEQVYQANDIFNYSKEFWDYLLSVTCVAFDVTRQELGLEPANTDGLGGSGFADAMLDVQQRRSLLPLCAWLADTIFTPILREDFGLTGFRWAWPELMQQDPKLTAEVTQQRLFSGQVSLDEVLMDQGDDPVGVGRFIVIGPKVYFEPDLIALSKDGAIALEQQQQEAQAEHQADLQRQQAEHEASLQPDPVRGADNGPASAEGGASTTKSAAPTPTPTPASVDGPADGPVEYGEGAYGADLRRWERKALKAARAGKSPLVPFQSAALDDTVRAVVAAALATATTPAEIRAAFVPPARVVADDGVVS